jgi:hypothetical protein
MFSSKGVKSRNNNSKIELGERVACTLDKMSVEADGHLTFNVSNDTGVMSHKELSIDPTHPSYNEKYAADKIERIKHVCCCFIDEEDIDDIEAPDFKSWAEQLVSMMTPHFGGSMVAKIVRSKKNWPTFPLYTNFCSSEKAPAGWTTNPTYDIYEYSSEPSAKDNADKDDQVKPQAKSDDDEF